MFFLVVLKKKNIISFFFNFIFYFFYFFLQHTLDSVNEMRNACVDLAESVSEKIELIGSELVNSSNEINDEIVEIKHNQKKFENNGKLHIIC